MAVGVLTGGIGQLVFQIPLFRTLGYDFKPSFDFRDPDFRRVLRQWLPVLATASIFTVTQQVAIRFATGLEEGSASAMNYAIVFWQLPFGVFSASITTVLFPKMSREAGSNLTGELRETVGYGLRSLYVFLIPSAVLLIVFGKEIISVAMFRRRFDEAATLLTARVMMGYAIGLWSVGAYTFLQRFFYSVGDYRTPVVSAGIIAVLDIILSLWLKETALRVTGLAVANSVSFTVGTAFFLVSAHSRLNGLPWRKMAKTFGKVTVVMVPILCIGVFYLRFTGDWWRNGSSFGSFGLLAAGGGGSLALVLLGYRLAKVEAIITMARRRKR